MGDCWNLEMKSSQQRLKQEHMETGREISISDECAANNAAYWLEDGKLGVETPNFQEECKDLDDALHSQFSHLST